MSHILAKLKNVKLEHIAQALKDDATKHSAEGMYLEHLWLNLDDQDEVCFLFRVDDLVHAKQFIEAEHRAATMKDPSVHLPEMTYLE